MWIEDSNDDRIMRLPEVIRVTGHCRSMIYLLMREDRFPRSVKTGKRSVGWARSAVKTYIRVILAGGEYRASIYQQSDVDRYEPAA